MTDVSTSRNDHETNTSKIRWRLVLTSVAVIICLILMIAIGSILVNVEWPTNVGDWLKALLGGLLILISTIGVTYATSAVKAVIKDRGGASSEHRDKYLAIERLSRITPRRAVLSVVLAGAIFAGATLIPRIPVPQPPPAEPGDIRLMSAIDESSDDARFTLIQQWNAAHPENRVELIPVSGETDDQHLSMVNNAQSTRPADVYVLDIVWMTEFIEKGYIRPLDESRLVRYEGDQFLPNSWETCLDLKGDRPGRWALPFNADAGLLYHRSDLDVPAPSRWDDYFGTSAKDSLTAARSTPEARQTAPNLVAANAAQLAPEEVLTVNALEAIWAAGGEVVNRTGEVALNADRSEVVFDASARAALADLAEAAHDPAVVAPGADEADEDASRATFTDGQTLFMRNWPVAYDKLMSEGGQAVPFGVTTLPHDSVLGGQNLAISSATQKPRAAQELIEFLTSPASQLTLFEIGGFAPTRPSAYAKSRRPYASDLRTVVERARPRPLLVHYTEFSVEFRTGIRRALNAEGELEPDFARKLADIVKKG